MFLESFTPSSPETNFNGDDDDVSCFLRKLHSADASVIRAQFATTLELRENSRGLRARIRVSSRWAATRPDRGRFCKETWSQISRMKNPYLSVSGWRKKKPSMKTVAAVEAGSWWTQWRGDSRPMCEPSTRSAPAARHQARRGQTATHATAAEVAVPPPAKEHY